MLICIWHEEKLRELRLISLQKKKLREDLINVYEYLVEGSKEVWGRLFSSGIPSEDVRQWAKIEIQEIPFKHKKKLSYCEDGQTLEQVTQRWHRVSSHTQNMTGHDPEQPNLVDIALRMRAELDNLQRSPSISIAMRLTL